MKNFYQSSSLAVRSSSCELVVNSDVERVKLIDNGVPVVILLWQRLGREGDVESCIDNAVLVRLEDYCHFVCGA